MARDRALAERRYNSTVQRRRLTIPSRDRGRCITVELYLPRLPLSKEPTVLPVLVNFHGSGFVLDNLFGSNVLACSQLASELGIAVLDTRYCKAPEHPFPGALYDVEDVLRWLGSRDPLPADLNQEISLDPTRVVLSGFSAGANLALTASSSSSSAFHGNNATAGLNICGVLAIYPLVDLVTPPSIRDGKGGWSLNAILLNLFLKCYMPGHTQTRLSSTSVASSSPSQSNDFPNKVPVVGIVTCETDILAAEGLDLVRRLREEEGFDDVDDHDKDSVSVKTKKRTVVRSLHLQGVDHGFDVGAKLGSPAWKRREEMNAMMVDTVRQAVMGDSK